MNKTELAQELAAKTGTTKVTAAANVDALLDIITSTLKKGGEVAILGFGTFKVTKRAARVASNPQKPGVKIKIPAKNVPKFTAGKALKDAVAK